MLRRCRRQLRGSATAGAGRAVYHRNLALAYELAELPDPERALDAAIQSLRRAIELTPTAEEYPKELRRLETRRSAYACYGPSRTTGYAPSVSSLAVEYGKDLSPFVRDESGGEWGADLQTRYEAVRARIRRQYGIIGP